MHMERQRKAAAKQKTIPAGFYLFLEKSLLIKKKDTKIRHNWTTQRYFIMG